MGYAMITAEGNKAQILECGCITTPAKTPDADRLLEIKRDLEVIIKKWKPEVMSIESLYFTNNAKTAMSVGQARGVAILMAAEHGLQIIEMTPLQVKMAITGYGKADKAQIQRMIPTIFGIKKIPKPDDAADAAAIAWAGIGRIKYSKLK